MASELLRPFDEDMTPRRARGHFAHVNSVKCSQNKRGKSEADSRLFTRCKGYLEGELAVLKPDVVVTQGAKARDAFRSCHQGTVKQIDVYSCVVRLANRDVLWLASVHQGAWHGAYQMQVANWPKWAESVKDHMRTRGKR